MNSLWGIIITSVAVVGIAGAIYLIYCISIFPGIKKFTNNKKVFRFLISFGILGTGFLLCFLTMSLVNAVIILIHMVLFRFLFGLAGFILKKMRKKEYAFYWQGWFSFIACVIYLSIGFFLCNHVFVTTYDLTTDKEIGHLKIVMFADSHIGTTFDGDGFLKQIENINRENPDVVFICGDFVDDGTTNEDMIKACEALGKITCKYGVWYVYGNHDKGYYGSNRRGFSSSDLEYNLILNKVHVLQDRVKEIGDGIVVVGRADASNRNRKKIDQLTQDIDEKNYIIVLNHQPTDYENEAGCNTDLVLSGHTHGGQFFPNTHGRYYRCK